MSLPLMKWGLFSAILVLAVATVAAIAFGITPQTPKLPDPPLKELARKHNLVIGNHAILNRLDEKPYTDILAGQHNFVLADNTPNWHFVGGGLRPSANEFNFRDMDKIMNFAKKNNMAVQAHHYLWGEEKWLPDWLKQGRYGHDELRRIMRRHILGVGRHYQGQIREWTVVNEAFTRNLHVNGLNDWWADNTGGTQYIDEAFVWAREADPGSKLILNDFQNETENEVSNAMYRYIRGALGRGIPIDGIGMQMHIDGTKPPTKEQVIANMKRFADLGVEVYVTEFDVNMNDVREGSDTKNLIEANIYHEMMRACIESKVCHSFAILGITDKETWYNHLGLPDARPLPFDDKYRPKPAYFALWNALNQD